MKGRQSFESVLDVAHDHSLRYLQYLDSNSVAATASLEVLRANIGRPLMKESLPAHRVIEDLVADVQGGLIGNASGRFFAWVEGGALQAPLAADWLTSAWDQNAASYAAGPAVAVIEEVCGAWLKDLFGLPATASFALTTGCQMAHTTALASARNHLLAQRGWDVEAKGLGGAPRVRIISSDQHHGSIYRAARLLGLGSDAIQALTADAHGKLDADLLEDVLQDNGDGVSIVLLQAGDINIGAFDAFDELIPIAHRHDAWVHVDGAFGLWVNATERYRHLLRGVELADSWATDGHKWLNVPYDCGYAFVAHPKAHLAAMSQRASYVSNHEQARDQRDWNPEWSRRARGVPTYAAIRQLGRAGVATMIETSCQSAHALVMELAALSGAQLMWEPQINQGLVRFLDPRPQASDADHDARTDEIVSRVNSAGEAFFSGTTWRSRRCMRVSVCNWQTDARDVERAVLAVANALRS